MRIQHNIMAINAYRNYTNNVSAMKTNLEKLSSGYKINRAGDDAAGLAISEKMRAQITGLQQAQANAKSGINLVQTAEGALQEVQDMLNRMVKLAEQSANGTFDDGVDRNQLQKEFSRLTEEIDRIADSANFNGIKLLDGSMAGAGTTDTTTTKTALEITADAGNTGTVGTTNVPAVEVGDPLTAAKYEYTIGTALDASKDASIKIAGKTFTVGSGSGDIDVADATDEEAQAAAIKDLLAADSTIANKYDITVEDATITLTAKDKGVDANADTMKGLEVIGDTGTGTATATETTPGADGTAAVYTYKITNALVATDGKITIAGKTFTVGSGSGDIDVATDDDADKQAAAIKALLEGDEELDAKYTFGVSNDTITVTAKDATVDANADAMTASVVVTKATAGEASVVETAGTVATEAAEASKTYNLGSLSDGDKITIDGNEYEYDSTITESTTGKFKDLDTLKDAIAENDPDSEITVGGTDLTDVTVSKTTSKTSTSGGALKLQIGDTAHKYNKIVVSINSIKSDALIDMTTRDELADGKTVTAMQADGVTPMTKALTLKDIKVETQDDAAEALGALKGMVNYISDIRGELGATQNRLNHTINNLSVMTENIQDAESTIRDTDVADEMMAYTKNNILIQSAQAMLAQANQVPQGVLQLLQ